MSTIPAFGLSVHWIAVKAVIGSYTASHCSVFLQPINDAIPGRAGILPHMLWRVRDAHSQGRLQSKYLSDFNRVPLIENGLALRAG